MKVLKKVQYKDQIWHEVVDVPREERHNPYSPYPSKDTQPSTVQTDSLRGESQSTGPRSDKE